MAVHRDPVREWREQVGRRNLNLDFRPLSDAPFSARIGPIFADLCLARFALSPGVTFRDEELVKDGDDAFGLMISGSRDLGFAHRARDLRLGPGDATLMHVSAPGRVGSRHGFRWTSVKIPNPELAERIAHPEDAVMRRVPRRSEALRLLRGYIRTVEGTGPGASAEVRGTIRRHIVDLVALALAPASGGAIGESGASAVVAARVGAALDHVAGHFQEPDLSLEGSARRQGISPRYLQRLFELAGTSFTARVNELRLQKAFSLLGERREGARRVSDVALQVGFSDISHFNRKFRARFGETPSAVRAQCPPVDC